MFITVRTFLMVAFAAIIAVSASAVTYIVPSDAEMIQRSDDIVVATAVASTVERDSRGAIVTRYVLRVERVLKGERSAGSYITVTEQGGILDGRVRAIGGTPEYAHGSRYLVFTETDPTMEPTTFGMSLGQFSLAENRGEVVAVRSGIHGFDQNMEAHVERPRVASRFEAYIRDVVAQRPPRQADYFLPVSQQIAAEAIVANATFTRASYMMNGRLRWQSTPNANFVLSVQAPAAIPSGGSAAVTTAVGHWNGTDSNIAYSVGGNDNTAVAGLTTDDGKDSVLFGDPNDEVNSPFVALGGAFGDIQYTLDGETFARTIEVDIVVNEGQTSCLDPIITHEMGHTLGIRHSATAPTGFVCNTTAECTSSAIMNASVSCGGNGALLTWDENAAATIYGSGPVCNPPTITTHPAASTNLTLGSTVQLSVTASGSSPLSYQWYSGLSPDTSEPIPGATTNKLNVTPQVAGTFAVWVRVSNGCDGGSSVNSNTALVIAACANPAITAGPQSVTITQGQSTQLSVTATGTGLSYMWFKGESGDRSNPVGTNSNKLTVSPSETSKYWVRVNGTCGPGVDSAAATVTVNACAAITVNAPTATQGTGNNFTLSVGASSSATPLTFEWFRGNTPGVGGDKIASTQNVTVAVTTPTTFWARVKNACGRTEVSSLLAVGCTLPAITAEPQDQTINSGQTANLSLAFTGGTGVKWYRGTVGDKTTEVGSTADVIVGPLTETTQFWAEVSSSCGPVASRQVTVTVRALSELVPMLGGRFFVQVNYRNQFDNGKEGKLLGRSLFSTPLSETLVFTFGDPNVVELLVRLSDARPFDDSIHVFLGGLSDVEFSVVVTDSLTGIVHEYKKPPNELVGVIDRQTFPAATSLPLMAASSIAPTAETSTILLLNRFEVRMRYRNQFTNPAGEGYMNARSIASSPTTETAVFFFDENVGSVEWMVRFSDARPFAERIDMFHGGLSDVEFTIEVHDTKTGERKEYHKGPFSLRGQIDRDSYQP